MDHSILQTNAGAHLPAEASSGSGSGADSGTGVELPATAVWAAGFFAFSSTLISMVAIWMQLKNYRKPLLQRYVVRILWMVPFFAISSWISLVSLNLAFYVDALRDVYEAFVIYCFFSLLVSYLGGERALLIMLHGRPYTKHLFPVRLWSREMDVGDPYSFLFIKRGILQYVYVKPVLAAITMLLKSVGAYNDGSLSLKSGYFWISFIYNLSVCLSLYCLGMFFMATQEDLEDFRPIPKFLCIKILFLVSFYQGVAISVLVSTGVLRSTTPESAVAIQDFLLCLEMIFVGLGHWYAFSHRDYVENEVHSARLPFYYAIRDACGIQDVIQDSLETLRGTRFTYRTFEPSEGVATVGMSRSGRIMAGLRYSGGGTSKYWLPDTLNETLLSPGSEDHRFDFSKNPQQPPQQNSRDRQRFNKNVERPPSLYFADLSGEDDDGVEELYDSSKQMEFGDYNFPTIDTSDSNETSYNKKRSKKEKKRYLRNEYPQQVEEARLDTQSSVFGNEDWKRSLSSSLSPSPTVPSMSSSSTAAAMAREGCVDNVNGYVPQPRRQKSRRFSPPPGTGSRTDDPQEQGKQQHQQAFEDDKDRGGGPVLFFV